MIGFQILAGSGLRAGLLFKLEKLFTCQKSKINALPKVVDFFWSFRSPPAGKVRIGWMQGTAL